MSVRAATALVFLGLLAGCPEAPPDDLATEARLEPTAEALRRPGLPAEPRLGGPPHDPAEEGPIRIQVIEMPRDEPPPRWLPLAIGGGFGGGLAVLATLAYALLVRPSDGEEEPPTP